MALKGLIFSFLLGKIAEKAVCRSVFFTTMAKTEGLQIFKSIYFMDTYTIEGHETEKIRA